MMRVLIADDHTLFRDGITAMLETAGFEVIAQVGDGLAAVETALRLCPDVVLLDIAMPGIDGLEALRQIKAGLPETPVVMLTASADDDNLFRAIALGARGYLMKDLPADKFLEMLRGLENGEVAITRKTAARLIDGFSAAVYQRADPAEILTKRELELLQFLAEGLSNRVIARRLSISQNTVKYHLKTIFQKLDVQNRTEAAAYAFRTGLIRPDPSN